MTAYFNLKSGDFMRSIAYIVLLVCLPGIFNILADAGPANAQETAVTAGDVDVDEPATLRAFVEYAKTQLDDIADAAELAVVWSSMRLEGDWKSGDIYLIVLNSRGSVLFHADQPDAEGKTLRRIVDARRDSTGRNLLMEAAAGGGFVGYYWDDPDVEGDDSGHPKVAYATQFFSEATNENHILVGGFYQDLTDLPAGDPVSAPRPDITAGEVVDAGDPEGLCRKRPQGLFHCARTDRAGETYDHPGGLQSRRRTLETRLDLCVRFYNRRVSGLSRGGPRARGETHQLRA